MDYRSVEELEVCQNGARVGVLSRRPRGCEFRYDAAFLASDTLPIALHLPKTPEPLITEGILNLPTFFAGLLPEGIMLAAAQSLLGSAKDDLFAVLAATARDAIGDVTVRIPGDRDPSTGVPDLERAKEEFDRLLSRRDPARSAINAIPGVQPKLSLGSVVRATRGKRFIAKFESPEFPGLPQNELACMTLARRCGLNVPPAKVEQGVYIVERFDRHPDGSRVHVEDMLQAMDLFPRDKYSVDYAELCAAMTELRVSKAALLEAIQLYAFSYLIGNGDLHAKNVSLIRKPDGQWVLSPAYDLVSTLPYRSQLDRADAMAIPLADEAIGRFEPGDFTQFGLRFGVPERATRKMLSRLARNVTRHAPEILAKVLPPEDLRIVLDRAAVMA